MSEIIKKVEEAVKFILELDLTDKPCGKYIVDEDFYYLIQEYETKYPNQGRYEAHENYVDIQYIVEGTERMEVADVEGLVVETPYNPEKDVVFFKDPKKWTTYVVEQGEYLVFYPEDAHKPGLCIEAPTKAKKIVRKVRM